MDVVVYDGVLQTGKQVGRLEAFIAGLGRGISHEHRAHLPQVGRTRGPGRHAREFLDVVYSMEDCLLFEERAGSGAAGLVHVALDDSTAANLDELGVLSADLDDRQGIAVSRVASNGRRGVCDNLVFHVDAILGRGIGRADYRRRRFAARTGQPDGSHVGTAAGQERLDQPARGFDGIAPAAVVDA